MLIESPIKLKIVSLRFLFKINPIMIGGYKKFALYETFGFLGKES